MVFDLRRGARWNTSTPATTTRSSCARDGTVHDLGRAAPCWAWWRTPGTSGAASACDPDDLLVFYSDGVTDRGNAEGELYGIERLKDAARRSRGDAARIVLYSLLGDVQGWSGGLPAEDDATLIVAKVR